MQLRPYQDIAVENIRTSFKDGFKGVLAVFPTGSGKTVIFSYISMNASQKNKTVWILVHRVELLRQTSAALSNFGVKHGLVNPKFSPNPLERVQVASVQTMIKRMDKFPKPDIIIIDECFPGNTLVDGKRIDQLEIGDQVRSFNHDNSKIEYKSIQKIHKREYNGDWYKIRLSTGIEVICTENHPFYISGHGYVFAKNIKNIGANSSVMPIFVHDEKYMYLLQKGIQAESEAQSEKVLRHNLQDIPLQRNFTTATKNELCAVRKRIFSILQNKKGTLGSFKKREILLLRTMQKRIFKKNKFRNDVKNKSNSLLRKNEKKQSNVKYRIKTKNDSKNDWKNFFIKRRKWSANKTANKAIRSIESTNGTRYNGFISKGYVSERTKSLQSGFSLSTDQISNRSGWRITQAKEVEVPRQEKNRNIRGSRLDCVEVYKQGSGQRPEWVPRNNTVYNLHIEDNLNYFANSVLVHNCHHSTAGSWRKIIDANSDALILGVTATPCRSDGTGLDHIFDKIIIGPQISELIELGYLVKPKVFAPAQKIDLSKIDIVRGDYDSKQVTELLDKPSITGDAVQHYIKFASGRPAVAFCTSISHAEHVAEAFRNKGYRFYSVDGTMDDETRKNLLEGLGNGSIDGICSCDLISEGTDIPAIGCAILLRPTQSLSLYIQQIGRALRTQDGKTEAIILDHVGNVITHGFPTIDREWSLEGSKRTKKSMSEQTIRVNQCNECFAVHEPAPVCPECGFVYPLIERNNSPKEIDGELLEIQENEIKKQKSLEVSKARTLDELLLIQKERGYKFGWAQNMMRMRSNSQYKTLLADADNFIRVENYAKAKERYEKAIELNINNTYVNECISKLEILISEKFEEII